MKSLVEIPEPCNIDWNTMSPLSTNKRYCNSCAKPVVDFSSCSLEEIKSYFSNPENSSTCGKYNRRHTEQANEIEKKLTAIEVYFSRIKLQGLAVVFIGMVLFFSSCRRHIQGKMTYHSKANSKSPNKTQNLTGNKK